MKSVLSFKEFEGKTISHFDESCSNMVVIVFTDGSKYDVYAECVSGDYSTPFFEIYNAKDKE